MAYREMGKRDVDDGSGHGLFLLVEVIIGLYFVSSRRRGRHGMTALILWAVALLCRLPPRSAESDFGSVTDPVSVAASLKAYSPCGLGIPYWQ